MAETISLNLDDAFKAMGGIAEVQNMPEAACFRESQYWVYTRTAASRSLDAGAGNDFIAGGEGADTLLGGAGFDYIMADVRGIPNGGLDENGQLKTPPSDFSNNTISGPSTMVHSGDSSDVFIDAAVGTPSGSTPAGYLHIDSKLYPIYKGKKRISLKKHIYQCLGASRKQRLKAKRAHRPYKTSIDCYGKRSVFRHLLDDAQFYSAGGVA
jgi:hypothetical protein